MDAGKRDDDGARQLARWSKLIERTICSARPFVRQSLGSIDDMRQVAILRSEERRVGKECRL